MTLSRGALIGVLALGACVSPSDIRQVESQVSMLRAESARRDSARAAQLTEVLRVQQRIMDSLAITRTALRSLRGDVGNDLYGIQQQLVQLQELTGQSQRRLTELRTQLEARGEQIAAETPGDTAAGPGAPPGRGPAGSSASAEQIYESSLQQLRRGSTSTARLGLKELLRTHPTSDRVPDALYFIGQSFASENPDSAARYYQQVVQSHPKSARAPAALYNLGLLAERRKDTAAAREAYQRVVQTYPNSDEAALARDQLRTLGG